MIAPHVWEHVPTAVARACSIVEDDTGRAVNAVAVRDNVEGKLLRLDSAVRAMIDAERDLESLGRYRSGLLSATVVALRTLADIAGPEGDA